MTLNQFNVENKWYFFADEIRSVSGELTLANDLNINEDLSVNGHIDANDASFNNVDVSGDLTVNGNVTGTNLNIANWNNAISNPVTVSIIPQNNNSVDLGSNTNKFNEIYTYNLRGGHTNTRIDLTQSDEIRFYGGNSTRHYEVRNDTFNAKSGNSNATMYLNWYGSSVRMQQNVIVTSDDRIKFDETNLTNALDVIKQLSPEKYIKRYPDEEEGFTEIGFIAQEVATIPELSSCIIPGEKEYIEGDPDTNYMGLNYTGIFTYGIAAIKELDAIVQAQATIIADLQQRLTALET